LQSSEEVEYTTSTMDRKPPSAVRLGLSSTRVPPSPQTPQRATPSTFSSPSTTFRQDEDAVIIELGARYLRAGFEGESAHQCCLSFGPSDSRRVGDYRDWIPGYAERPKRLPAGNEWGSDHELWRMDLRDVDLGLVEDKLERAVREAYTQSLLTDPGSQRLILVLPSVVPHQLLEAVLVTLFSHFRFHGVSLLQQPTMCVVAAGLRSGLVVDIGWAETIITAVYEYRECHSRRSVRGMKLVTQEMGRLIARIGQIARMDQADHQRSEEGAVKEEDKIPSLVTLDHCEEVMARLAWCRLRSPTEPSTIDQLSTLSISDHNDTGNAEDPQITLNARVSVPVSSAPSSRFVEVPIQDLAEPVEQALFEGDPQVHNLDDDEHPLPLLVYEALLALPPDVRGICMSRIIVTGGGSEIPGLKKRLMDEVAALIERYGWDARRGKLLDSQREKRQTAQTLAHPQPPSADASTEQSNSRFWELLRRNLARDTAPSVHGVLRQVDSLGAWAGASLMASLRVKGLVEIDRDKFLQHGLLGGTRDAETNVHSQRLSFGAAIQKTIAGDRQGAMLGAWA
jgi:hypothetical protein